MPLAPKSPSSNNNHHQRGSSSVIYGYMTWTLILLWVLGYMCKATTVETILCAVGVCRHRPVCFVITRRLERWRIGTDAVWYAAKRKQAQTRWQCTYISYVSTERAACMLRMAFPEVCLVFKGWNSCHLCQEQSLRPWRYRFLRVALLGPTVRLRLVEVRWLGNRNGRNARHKAWKRNEWPRTISLLLILDPAVVRVSPLRLTT